MIRTITQEIWEQVLDENGNIVFDENGTAKLKFIGTQEIEENFDDSIQVVFFLGEFEYDPSPLKINTSWILIQNGKRIWKKYTSEGLESVDLD